MKAFAKYFALTLVIAVMLHYTIEKSAIAGCQHGVFFMLNDMFGGIDYNELLSEKTEALCKQILK